MCLGCSVHSIQYNVPMRQIEALIQLSNQCEQYIRYNYPNIDGASNMQHEQDIRLFWYFETNIENNIVQNIIVLEFS